MITGFPSPAQGYEDNKFDLNRFLIKHPAATTFMNVDTNRFRNLGIYNGDLLIVDRAKRITVNSLVVYESDGQLMIGYVSSIHSEAIIRGAITQVIHTVRER